MEKIRKSKGLVWKLTWMVSLLLLAAMILICSIFIQIYRRTFQDEINNRLNTSLNYMQEHIQKSLEDADSILNRLTFTLEFPYFLDYHNTLTESEMHYYSFNLDRDLINIKYLYKNRFSDIGVFSSNQQISEESFTWQFYLDDLKKKPYFYEINGSEEQNIYGHVREREMMSSYLNHSNLTLADSGIRILPIYRKVYSLNTHELVGVLEMDVDVTHLADKNALAREDTDIGKLLLDRDGQVLFDTVSRSDEDRKQLAEAVRQSTGSNEVRLSDGTYMFTAFVSQDTGLTSVVISSKAALTNNILSMSVLIIVMAVLFWGALVTLTWVFVRKSLIRMVVLDQMMGKVGEGDFTVEIPEDNSEDEVARITHSFNHMAGRLNHVMEEKIQNEQAQKDAELRALQAQINPHFLYNTLENMRMQCEIDEYYTLGSSLSALSNLFRYSISWGNNEAPFEMEWRNLLDYLDIMKMRFEDSVEYELYCEEGLEDIMVPKLMLQPLVENCFNHGFKEKLPPWKLEVIAVKEENCLCITIRDNGFGMPPEQLEHLLQCLQANKPFCNEASKKNSIGVANVKQRIDMVCQEGSTMRVDSALLKGTTIIIEIVC